MIYVENFDIPRKTFDLYEAILRGERPWEDGIVGDVGVGQDMITAFSVDMGDDYVIDFNITKCEQNVPYLDIILFEDGCEVYSWPISDTLLGCWEAVFGGVTQSAFRVETYV